MDMIRWLATNKVVMTVWGLGFLAMLLALVFGGGDKVEAKADAVETKVVETVAEVVTPVATAAVATAAVASTAVLAAVDTATEAVVKVAAEVTEVASEAVVVVEAEVTTEQVKAMDAATGVAQEAMAVEASTDAAVVVGEGDLSGKSTDDLLMMAREAYWDNGLDQAATLYSELITREPTVIEHKGELGNVFWRQGYPKKAAELYADIAEPMIAQGNGERVSNMVGFIGLFFPERATGIRKQLDAQ